MSIRVAINGFGRIGRMVMRAVKERRLDVDFIAINDVADVEPLGMVLRYDSIHGRYPGKDMRRGRMASVNIVPTSTGAAKALGLVIPSLAGKVEGLAFRVPVPSGSVVDLTVYTEKKADVQEIHDLMRRAAEGPMKGILKVSTDSIVSADIVGDAHSAIYDAPLTQVLGERMVKVVAWYDNEWAYAMRVAEMIPKVHAL
jgi:glyceraldehyde 3-phosphate dehydrogenase (phosphorylating)